jgi:hypothetical protein
MVAQVITDLAGTGQVEVDQQVLGQDEQEGVLPKATPR